MKYLFLFLFLFSLHPTVNSQTLDITILKDINLNRNKKLDNTFEFISNSIFPISIGIPIGTICVGMIKHDSVIKQKGKLIGASLILATGIAYGLKYAVNRNRPYITYPFLENVTTENSPSFPSGHSSDAFATATSLSLAFSKWYVIAPSYLWACSVAYSRMDLGVHYPSDVMVGAIIGAGSSFLCFKANKWLQHKKSVRRIEGN